MEVNDFPTYENKEIGIKIKYHPDWTYVPGIIKSLIVVFNSPLDKDIIEAKLKEIEAKLEEPSPNLAIWVFTTVNKSLELYTTEKIEELKNTAPDFSLAESSSFILDGNKGYKIVYTFLNSFLNKNQIMKILDVWAIKDNRAFDIIYMADSQKYNNYYALIESMISSFKITYVPSSHYNPGHDIMDQNVERKTNND